MGGLRIGVNALYLIPGGVGGTEIYLRNLLAAMGELGASHTFVVFTNQETGTDLLPAKGDFVAAVQSVRAASRPARLLWEQAMLPGAIRRARVDVLFNPGFTAPFCCPCPSVTVFHDLQHKRHPEHFRWFDLPFWRFFLYWSARRSDRLIAVSGATRDDLVRFYKMNPSEIEVIPHGVEEEFSVIGGQRQQAELRPYFLCVSTLHPHKNLERLVRCFGVFRQRKPEFRLILAGMRGFQTQALHQQIAALGLTADIELTGWIPRPDLYDLYRHAWAFLYPSTFEGFGMPVIEALAAGIPTGCSNIEPLRTIAGDAALQFQPEDEDGIVQAMRRLAEDTELRQRLSAAGPEQARQYSWRTAAAQTLRVLETAAKSR